MNDSAIVMLVWVLVRALQKGIIQLDQFTALVDTVVGEKEQ